MEDFGGFPLLDRSRPIAVQLQVLILVNIKTTIFYDLTPSSLVDAAGTLCLRLEINLQSVKIEAGSSPKLLYLSSKLHDVTFRNIMTFNSCG